MTSIPRPSNPRAESEFELLALSSPTSPYQTQTTVLNLAGLWGGTRIPRNWVSRVAPTKDALVKKGSVHFIHGEDVARAIIVVHRRFSPGQRWILTDERVYDCDVILFTRFVLLD
jgi:nucleoside-diphosphate-sugar epimerase